MENFRIEKFSRRWEVRYGTNNLVGSLNFQSISIFSENLVGIELKKNRCVFNKPIYIEMLIFDISKVCL